MSVAAEVLTFPTPAAEPAVRPFRRVGMGYVWELADHHVTVRADRLAHRSYELTAEVEIQINGKHLHLARHNLSSTASRASLVKALSGRVATVPWEKVIEQFCVGVIKKEREGEAVQHARPTAVRQTRYLVEKLAIQGKPCMVYGPGGGAKGYLAVATCVGVMAGHGVGPLSVMRATPLYLDWEDDYATFSERVTRVANGWGIDVPAVPYRRMRGALPDQIADVARLIDEQRSTYVVIDSFSAAAGQGDGANARWDDIAHRFFDALDLVPNVTWLIIGHVSADGAHNQSLARKAFGSIQIMNRLRVAWEMRSERDPSGTAIKAALYHTKYNHTDLFPPIGLNVSFDDEAVYFEDTRVVATTRTLADRIEADLHESGERSVRALGLALREPENKIRAILSREKDRFRHLENGNWALALTVADDEEGLPWR